MVYKIKMNMIHNQDVLERFNNKAIIECLSTYLMKFEPIDTLFRLLGILKILFTQQ